MACLDGKVALVTGASSGIGRAIALALAEEGADLALVARNAARLDVTARAAAVFGIKASVFPADLADPHETNRLGEQISSTFDGLDILIHAAGAVTSGTLAETPTEVLESILRINTVAPYTITQIFLPQLIASRGHIVFINSRAGFLSFPKLTQYCASKHALLAIANGLRQEVEKDGVRVLSVLPGKVATPLLEAVRKEQGEDYIPENYLQPKDVAQVVLTALLLPDNATMTDVIVAPQGEARKAGIQ